MWSGLESKACYDKFFRFIGDLTIKRETFIKLALIGMGSGLGLLLLLLAFVLVKGDARLLLAYVYDDVIVYRAGMGDILYWQGEFIAPLENPEEILSVHRLEVDEWGFRMPARTAEQYQVVALGDFIYRRCECRDALA